MFESREKIGQPTKGRKMSRHEFSELPMEETRSLVLQKNMPHTGIFVTDGNRRLVMTQTGLTPASGGFYDAYLRIVTESFMKNLTVFFDHGLNTLLFPLLGSSLLMRGDRYRLHVIPELIRILFQSEEWLAFYRKHGIRIKTYGDMDILRRQFPDTDLVEIIKQCEDHTRDHRKHRLFYGFFSTTTLSMSTIQKINLFIEDHNREPDRAESAYLYYGEPVAPADFFITSTRMGGFGALPPWAYGKETRMYTLVVPAVSALNEKTYKDVLYDLMFLRPGGSNHDSSDTVEEDIEGLREYHHRNRNGVIGTGEIVGKCWVLDV